DDFIKLQGAAAFEALLAGSEVGTEFRMAQIAGKYDLANDENRIAYCAEASELIASLPSAVEREIYTAKAAETAKITAEAMKLEVTRAFRRRARQEKRSEERKSLNPAAQLQPKVRTLRYENMRSARAEEGVLRLLVLDETLFPAEPPLQEEEFSSPLLGRAFSILWQMHESGRRPSLGALSEHFTSEEMSHFSAVFQQPESAGNGAQALTDYVRIIHEEAQKRGEDADPLLEAMQRYKKEKRGKQNG
ncbi:MAG: DNA primase, partial [Oscillibacter sp.]|nr:DNA primase [Oscillibacter sp.]